MSDIRKIFILISLIIAVTVSLSAQKRSGDYEPESVFRDAKTLYDSKNYGAAAELFQQYLTMAAGQNAQKTIEAKFYEAACASYLGSGERQLAQFSKENPTSIFAAKADFLYANTLFKNKKYRDALKKYEEIGKAEAQSWPLSPFPVPRGKKQWMKQSDFTMNSLS